MILFGLFGAVAFWVVFKENHVVLVSPNVSINAIGDFFKN